MEKINITTIENLKVNELSDLILSRMEFSTLFLPNILDIIYHALTKFNFRKLKNEESTIKFYCKKVLSLNYHPLTFSDPILMFQSIYLKIKDSPYSEKIRLETEVKKDLRIIDNLLNHYLSLEYITRLEKKSDLPRNHEEKKIKEFYLRTKLKREVVVNHLIYEVDKIAIKNMLPKTMRHKIGEDIQVYYDFPYREHILDGEFQFGINIVKLDYRKINLQWHKKTNWSFQFYKYGQESYSLQFLDAVKNKLDGKPYLQELLSKVKVLPFISDKEDILKELDKLYQMKFWYGFYALAIPQVEGLFHKMLKIISPSKTPKGVLPDKVKELRQHYENSDLFFDYYEYYLPELRNKFSHSGHIENIEIECKLILLDLYHIFEIFENIESPIIKLNKIIEEEGKTIEHIGHFADVFILIEKVKKLSQYEEIQEKVENFILKIIPKKIDLTKFISNLEKDFKMCTNNIETLTEYQFTSILKVKNFKLFSTEPKDLIKNKEKILISIENSIPILYNEELRLIFDTQIFCSLVQSNFPQLDKILVSKIKKLSIKYQNQFQIIEKLNKVFKINPSDGYLLKLKSFSHAIVNN